MSSSLYLEQYLDSLEPLPAELRRNFTLMHDLDTKNRKILEDVDAASDDYLRKVRDLGTTQRKSEMEKLQSMFTRARQNCDDKVQIAVQTYELVDKHIRRLDSDLAKFEAEMKEKGRLSQTETEGSDEDDEVEVKKSKKGKNSKSAAAAGGSTSGVGDKKNRKNAKADAAAAAAAEKGNKKGKKKSSTADQKSSTKTSAESGIGATGLGTLPPGMLSVPQEVLDMPVDPNEPTYCLCQQVSYGEMIGCDNADCPIEWFHFGCMNLTTKPKGKWYCPKCITQFKKKK